MKFKEDQNPDGMVVFLSDVWLDQIQVFSLTFRSYKAIDVWLTFLIYFSQLQVLEKLRILFSGYCEVPPVAFVLMGNFLSSQGKNSPRELRKLFKALADLIKEFQNLVENSRFIFVPGPSDLGFSNIIPRYFCFFFCC